MSEEFSSGTITPPPQKKNPFGQDFFQTLDPNAELKIKVNALKSESVVTLHLIGVCLTIVVNLFTISTQPPNSDPQLSRGPWATLLPDK